MRRWIAAVVLAGAVPAWAAPSAAAEPPKRECRVHFERAIRLYRGGLFAESAEELKAAYVCAPAPALFFDLGQAYRLAGETEDAVTAYSTYLQLVPDAANRAEVETLISQLERDRPHAPAPVVAEPITVAPALVSLRPAPSRLSYDATPARTRSVLIGSIAAMGLVGTVALATGVGLSLRAANDAAALEGAAPGSRWTAEQAARYDDGRSARGASTGLLIVGGAVLTAGVITAILGRRTLPASPETRRAQAAGGLRWSF